MNTDAEREAHFTTWLAEHRGIVSKIARAYAAAFAFIWWKQGRSGWPMVASMALILGVVTGFVRERFRVRRQRVGIDAPLLVRLNAEIAELRHQRDLFSKIWIWYFGPCLTATVIAGQTIRRNRPAWDISHDPIFLGSFYALLFFLVGWAWWMNWRGGAPTA